MTAETGAVTGAPGREVAETAALLVFVGSGISAVISLCMLCMSASGSVGWAALLGVVAVAGLTITTFSLHRLGRHARPGE
jgi:hypothetical protein